jgi:hypothetical protein
MAQLRRAVAKAYDLQKIVSAQISLLLDLPQSARICAGIRTAPRAKTLYTRDI